jgi:uncharacterized LabA/DUF88 family protein
MNKNEVKNFLIRCEQTKERNVVIIDFANIDRWEESLGWKVGIKNLGKLVSHISYGKKFLRRFYYGEDFGPKGSSIKLTAWSERILKNAKLSSFEIITKRVKYIPDSKYETGFIKKCNLDIEMAVDLIRERDNYDNAFVFSGDGDMAYVCEYLHNSFNKKISIFVARDHLGKELVILKDRGLIEDILFVEDFEYRLNLTRC